MLLFKISQAQEKERENNRNRKIRSEKKPTSNKY